MTVVEYAVFFNIFTALQVTIAPECIFLKQNLDLKRSTKVLRFFIKDVNYSVIAGVS